MIKQALFLAILFLVSTTAISQKVTINPATSYQEVTFGGDAKLTITAYADGNTNTVSDKLFGEMNLRILRVPIYALRSIDHAVYGDVITVIKSAQAENSNVKIFASIANGDALGNDKHGADKFPSSWRGCCSANVYSLNLTQYAAYLDSFMSKMSSNGITIDYLGPWNEDSADDSDHRKVFDQMNNLGSTKKVGLERFALQTSINDVNDVEDRTDIIGSHFYDDGLDHPGIAENSWNSKWAELVSKSADPVWYTESTRYSTSDNIGNLVAGIENIIPAIRGGAEAVIFYQACNRIVYANGGTPPIKFSGFKNIVNNAWGKVMNSWTNQSALKVMTFGNNNIINTHIINASNSNKTVQIQLNNGYKANGLVTRNIWTSSNTGKTNTYTLTNQSTWNVTVNANSYCHLNIPLNNNVSSKESTKKSITIDENSINDNQNSEFEIFPNPSNGQFQISLPEDSTDEKIVIKIFSLDGTEVLSETRKYESRILFNSKLASGVYFVKATTNNDIIYEGKIIIK